MLGHKHDEQAMDMLLSRIRSEGYRDHRSHAVRYKALLEAVNRYCPPDVYSQVMGWSERCEEKYLEEEQREFDERYPDPRTK